MPAINRIAAWADDLKSWRRHLHANPELSFDCHNTAAFVADRLRDFGITEIYTGIAQTGIVALVEGQSPGPTIGLRADMDALPILEETGADHASTIPGKMHACGHDGHTTMLLGAARYLAETRRFQSGSTDPFGRDFTKAPPLGENLCALKVTGALFHTQGGLDVDGAARVLNRAGTPITGRYAGGGAACGGA